MVIVSILTCTLQALSAASVFSSESGETPGTTESVPHFQVTRAASRIKINGVLDENAWDTALALELTYEIDPGENSPSPVRTECLITYDELNLYVGFRAHDPNPSQIRARLADRDTPYQDDFVGIMFDPFNDERRGFELFVNPLGVQMDLSRNEVGNGNQEDETWDAIWESAGRVVSDGYMVEMAVPFSSLRFSRSEGVQTWGIFPFRAYPRSVRHQLSAVPLDRDVNCFFCQAPKVTGFDGIMPGRSLEFDPTLTTIRTDNLDDSGKAMLSGDPDADAGVSIRWGMTPNLSLNGALNPDFSQVEADVAQLELNTRFALFFPEKRPFFLEGADFFDTPLQAIYSRTVTDPMTGIKLTGKEGKNALGFYAAGDDVNNLLFPSNQGSNEASLEQNVSSGVFRYRRDVGRNSTLGGLLTVREGEGYHNRVYGVDGNFRFTSKDGFRIQMLGSDTAYPDQILGDEDYDQPSGSFNGYGMRAFYLHESRNWNWWGLYQDKDPHFRADAGFIPRVDTRTLVAGAERVIWGDTDRWFQRWHFNFEAERTVDHAGTLTDQRMSFNSFYAGPLQTHLSLYGALDKEYFEGVTYDKTVGSMYYESQPLGSFNVWMQARFGDAIDYDNATAENPRLGKRLWGGPGFRYYIGRNFQVWLDDTFERLYMNGEHLFTANLIQTRLVYQFNVKTFVRVIFQYTDVLRNRPLYNDPEAVEGRSRDLFTQLLFSYKINPQTILFLGYSDNYDDDERTTILRTDRTFFFKIGYAWLV